MAKIFISYRTEDTLDFTGRLFDYLVNAFGREMVFKDDGSLLPGKRFDQQLFEAINEAEVVLVVIGPKWLETLQRRSQLVGERDYVREEVVAALTRKRPLLVVPILVGTTAMPTAHGLPKDLAPLSLREGHRIRQGVEEFADDAARLVTRLRKVCTGLPQNAGERATDSPPDTALRPSWRAWLGLEVTCLMGLAVVLLVSFWLMRFGFLTRDIETLRAGVQVGLVGAGLMIGYLLALLLCVVVPPNRLSHELGRRVVVVAGAILLGWGTHQYLLSCYQHLGEEGYAQGVHSLLSETIGLKTAIPALANPPPADALYRSATSDWQPGHYIDANGVLYWPNILHYRGWSEINLRDEKTVAFAETRWNGTRRVVVAPVAVDWPHECLSLGTFVHRCQSEEELAEFGAQLEAAAPSLKVTQSYLWFGSWGIEKGLVVLTASFVVVLSWWFVRLRTGRIDDDGEWILALLAGGGVLGCCWYVLIQGFTWWDTDSLIYMVVALGLIVALVILEHNDRPLNQASPKSRKDADEEPGTTCL